MNQALKEAYEGVENLLVKQTNLLQGLTIAIARLNAEALLQNEPTINWQLLAPDMRGFVEALFDQLENINPIHPNNALDRTVFKHELVQQAIVGAQAMTVLSHSMSVISGWWKDSEDGRDLREEPLMVPTKIALMHSELSEALEAYRKDLQDSHLPNRKGIEVEFADLLHRVFDLSGELGLDLGSAYIEKGFFNLQRADHKIANRALKGGKKY